MPVKGAHRGGEGRRGRGGEGRRVEGRIGEYGGDEGRREEIRIGEDKRKRSTILQNIDIVKYSCNTFISVLRKRIIGTQNFVLPQTL